MRAYIRYSYQGQNAEKDDETGWNHFELREYDPIIGRWLVPDPMGQHWSPYIAMGNDPVNSVDPDGGKDGPGDECPECAGWGAMLPSVEVSGEFTGSIGGSLEGLHFAGLTGTGYTSYDDAGNWYQTINRMQGNITYMYSNNEWSLYSDDARLNDAHLANVVSAADAVGRGTEFAISGALGGFGSALESTSLRIGAEVTNATATTTNAVVNTGIQFSKHSIERLAQRGVTLRMARITITKGQKFYDPVNKSINYVLPKAFASGKSLLVGTNPLSGQVTTVIRSSKNLINSRFIPIL